MARSHVRRHPPYRARNELSDALDAQRTQSHARRHGLVEFCVYRPGLDARSLKRHHRCFPLLLSLAGLQRWIVHHRLRPGHPARLLEAHGAHMCYGDHARVQQTPRWSYSKASLSFGLEQHRRVRPYPMRSLLVERVSARWLMHPRPVASQLPCLGRRSVSIGALCLGRLQPRLRNGKHPRLRHRLDLALLKILAQRIPQVPPLPFARIASTSPPVHCQCHR